MSSATVMSAVVKGLATSHSFVIAKSTEKKILQQVDCSW